MEVISGRDVVFHWNECFAGLLAAWTPISRSHTITIIDKVDVQLPVSGSTVLEWYYIFLSTESISTKPHKS
jgi:hypothetical protein